MRFITGLILLSCVFFSFDAFSEEAVDVRLSKIGDATHIEFSGPDRFEYSIQRDDGSLVLSLKNLGVEAIEKLLNYSDDLIQSISREDKDSRTQLRFTLSEYVDTFDYLSESPSRFILDVYPLEKQDVVENEKFDKNETKDLEPLNKRVPASVEFVLVPSEKKSSPSLAEILSSSENFRSGLFDGSDPEFKRFSFKDYQIDDEAIFRSQFSVFMDYPAAEMGLPRMEKLLSVSPSYSLSNEVSEENKKIRLIRHLSERGRYHSLIVAGEQFLRRYPNSVYREMVYYSLADSLIKIWRVNQDRESFDKAVSLYQFLIEKYPESTLTERTTLLLGYLHYENRNFFSSAEGFNRFLSRYPDSPINELVRYALADSYILINREGEAVEILNDLIENSQDKDLIVKSYYRLADIEFLNKRYKIAIDYYRKIRAKFPKRKYEYSHSWFNSAEAAFRIGDFRSASTYHQIFLQSYPRHKYASFALTRIGEILEIVGVESDRVRAVFRESYYRYLDEPGAAVARIRSLIHQVPEMDRREFHTYLTEIWHYVERFGEESEVFLNSLNQLWEDDSSFIALSDDIKKVNYMDAKLPHISDFIAVLLGKSLNSKKEFLPNKRFLTSFYQNRTNSIYKEKIEENLRSAIAYSIIEKQKNGHSVEALKMYYEEVEGWLRNEERLDLQMSLSDAFADVSLFSEAEKIVKQVEKDLLKLKESESYKYERFRQNLPTNTDIKLSLAKIHLGQERFVEAERKIIEAVNLELTDEEKMRAYEVAIDLFKDIGQADRVKSLIESMWGEDLEEREEADELHLKYAKILYESDKLEDTLEILEKIDFEDSVLTSQEKADGLLMAGRSFWRLGSLEKAQSLLNTYIQMASNEESIDGDEALFLMGQIYFQKGNTPTAQEKWSRLSGQNADYWRSLAENDLREEQWQNKYKRYLERLPAGIEEDS